MSAREPIIRGDGPRTPPPEPTRTNPAGNPDESGDEKLRPQRLSEVIGQRLAT